jgi:hypothetical protein
MIKIVLSKNIFSKNKKLTQILKNKNRKYFHKINPPLACQPTH